MDFEVLGEFFGMGDAAFDVAQRVAEFVGFAEFVGVVAFAGPGDAAQEHGFDGGVGEVLVPVAGDVDEGAVGFAAALGGAFVGPDLGLDVVDVDGLLHGDGFGGAGLGVLVALPAGVDGLGGVGGGEDADVVADVHVVVDLVDEVEVGDVFGDGVVAVGEVERHVGLEPLGGAEAPGTADDGFVVVGIAAGNRAAVDDDDAAAALDEGLEVLALGADVDVAGFFGVEDEDVGVVELFGGGEF